MAEIDSMQLYLNSKYSDQIYNESTGANSSCLFVFPYITCPSNYYINVSVINATIPFSFYQINQYNNQITIQYTGFSPVNYFIPFGNYNANQLANKLTTGYWAPTNPLYTVTNLKVTYNAITNKFLFLNTLSNNFKFPTEYTTCIEPLGLSTNVLYNTSIFGELNSGFSINLATVRAINIVTNYSSGNLSILEQNNFNTLASIPVVALPNSLIYYENSNDFKTNLYLGEINNINIKFTDQDNNSIDLNGLYYNLTLQVDILRFS